MFIAGYLNETSTVIFSTAIKTIGFSTGHSS
uniref:Uncharacterized protein n=1 Tax=Anguilla anguilla TaxID=7936 RepID=A0A0E9QR32_ANGAN